MACVGAIAPPTIAFLGLTSPPGLIPSVIRTVREQTQLPVLTGGLITRKQEVLSALDAGALAISSARPEVWRM